MSCPRSWATCRPTLIAALALVTAACADRDTGADTAQVQQAGVAAPATLAAAPDQFVTAGELRLRYRDAGSRTGSAIVFIHGFSRALEDWLMLADSFAVNHRVVAYDVRGFGQSTRFREASRYGASMVDDVIALLDHLGLERAWLVGHSMGADIAAHAAVQHPTRVAGVLLIAPALYPDSASATGFAARWVRDLERGAGMRRFLQWVFPGMPDSVARQWSAQTMAANDSTVMVLALRGIHGLSFPRTAAARASVPAVLAVGSRDPFAPASRRVARQWPNARLVEVADADHGSIVGHPQLIASMRAFIR